MKWLMILLTIGLWGGNGFSKEMSAKDLSREILELKSYAAEAKLVLRNYREGKVTAKFVKIHSEKAADALKDSQKKLEAPASQNVEPKRKWALELARQLRADFQQLQADPSDPAQAEALTGEFDKIYRALEGRPDA